jgi:hypothetical protein
MMFNLNWVELDLSLPLSSSGDEEPGDGAIFNMISLLVAYPLLVDPSLFPQPRKPSISMKRQPY